jgi:archaellum component FlaC
MYKGHKNKDIDQLKYLIQNTENEINDVTIKLKKYSNYFKDKTDKIDGINKNIDKIKTHISLISKDIELLKDKNNDLKDNLKDIKEEIKDIKNDKLTKFSIIISIIALIITLLIPIISTLTKQQTITPNKILKDKK